jgi:hypothetical protein
MVELHISSLCVCGCLSLYALDAWDLLVLSFLVCRTYHDSNDAQPPPPRSVIEPTRPLTAHSNGRPFSARPSTAHAESIYSSIRRHDMHHSHHVASTSGQASTPLEKSALLTRAHRPQSARPAATTDDKCRQLFTAVSRSHDHNSNHHYHRLHHGHWRRQLMLARQLQEDKAKKMTRASTLASAQHQEPLHQQHPVETTRNDLGQAGEETIFTQRDVQTMLEKDDEVGGKDHTMTEKPRDMVKALKRMMPEEAMPEHVHPDDGLTATKSVRLHNVQRQQQQRPQSATSIRSSSLRSSASSSSQRRDLGNSSHVVKLKRATFSPRHYNVAFKKLFLQMAKTKLLDEHNVDSRM